MTLARRAGRLLAILGLLAIPAAAPAVALADCQMAPPTEEGVKTAELVFVGTVIRTDANGFSADVDVEEVWRGDIPARLVLDGGLNVAQPAEDDRRFELGTRYLFMPTVLEGHLVDSICSGTVVWQDDFEALRPGDAIAPEAPGPAEGEEPEPGPLAALGGLVLPLATVLIIGGAVLVVAFLAGRRREA